MAMVEAVAPAIGHNRPPITRPDAEDLREELLAAVAPLYKRRDELLASAATVPAVIPNEEVAKELSDLLGMFRALLKTAKGQFELEKQPWLDAGRTVDGVFTAALIAPVEKMGKSLRERELTYIDEKAAKEKRRLQEEARKAQEEADRKLREAQEAERKRLAEIAEAERKQREEAAAAERKRQAEAEAARLEALKRAPTIAEPAPPPVPVAAAPAPEPLPPPPAPSMQPVNTLLDEAAAAASRAQELTKQAEAKPAEHGRVRGDRGGVSTIRKVWTGELVNRDELDLEALRQHFTEDAYNAAIRAFVKANAGEGKPAPQLRGARIWQRNV